MKYMLSIAVAIATVLILPVGTAKLRPPQPTSVEFDCAARELALEFAEKKLAWSTDLITHVYDALRLDQCLPNKKEKLRNFESASPLLPLRHGRVLGKKFATGSKREHGKIFVDASIGNDGADGTIDRPLRTIIAARDSARASTLNGTHMVPRTILLRGGRHYLKETLDLDARDDGITICAYGNEKVIISGGDRLQLVFRPTTENPRIYNSNLSGFPQDFNFTLLLKVNQEEDDDERLVWAREPNGHPERDLQPDGYAFAAGPGSAGQWPAPSDSGIHIVVREPRRNSTVYPIFGEDFDPRGGGNWYHVGGPGKRFVDQRGFWNGSVPTGLKYNETVFNASDWTSDGYAGAIAHVFHNALWGNWQFLIRSIDSDQQQIAFHPGGWQEGRGGRINRQPFFVEGVKEALDVPGEWWLDRKHQTLYYYPRLNETVNGTDSLVFECVAPRLKRLVAVMGQSEAYPATNITLRGLTFAHSAVTFVDRYEVPSPGDWSIRRDGVIFVENSRGFSIDRCRFIRTGGNAIFLSGHVKSSSITRNDFSWIGDSAIVTVGRLAMADGFTVDSFPEDTDIAENHFREIGIHGKQTSALFSALSCRTSFVDNVAYNGPRAGVNINDQFCHGHQIKGNLLFNWVRETQDHGPINTWNRAMYIQRNTLSREPTLTPEWVHVRQNFIMNGPSGNRDLGNLFPAIDNDDGSSYFHISENVLVYGGAKNYLGHDKIWTKNLIVYPGRWSGDPCAMLWAGNNHHFVENICIVDPKSTPIALDGTNQGFECGINWDDPTSLKLVGMSSNNSYFVDDVKSWGFSCGNSTAPDHFFTMAEMKAHGWELNSSVHESESLSPDDIIAMARKNLCLHS